MTSHPQAAPAAAHRTGFPLREAGCRTLAQTADPDAAEARRATTGGGWKV
ncbi:hypothetical protein ACWDZ4_22195 [Streptomyces sp. NPDC003016]